MNKPLLIPKHICTSCQQNSSDFNKYNSKADTFEKLRKGFLNTSYSLFNRPLVITFYLVGLNVLVLPGRAAGFPNPDHSPLFHDDKSHIRDTMRVLTLTAPQFHSQQAVLPSMTFHH